VGRIDEWRDLLSIHYHTLARARLAVAMVPEARAAAGNMMAILTKRAGEFASEASRSVLHGKYYVMSMLRRVWRCS